MAAASSNTIGSELMARLGDVFAAEPTVLLAYAFGSRVEGNVGESSDYDFAVLLERHVPFADAGARLRMALVRSVGTDKVDLVNLNRAPIELAFGVIARGVPIFQRDLATRVEYEADTMSRYYDYLPVLRAQREDLIHHTNHERRIQWHRAALERTRRTLEQVKRARRTAA